MVVLKFTFCALRQPHTIRAFPRLPRPDMFNARMIQAFMRGFTHASAAIQSTAAALVVSHGKQHALHRPRFGSTNGISSALLQT